ncbi:MAG TPA: hypothetical protein DDZ89_06810, partial [Clostridiales bacterium]|nr:hypothetical protein [Clostridiales bacterium]
MLRKKFESTGLNNISLSDFGYNLYSDHRKNSQNRQDSLTMAENEMNLLHHKDVKIMGQYGNGRLINKFDIITDIPLENSGFIAARESIPFLQMVVSGYVDYYGIPVNKSDNSRMAVLRSMEYGASGIKYLLTATDNTSAWQLKWNEYRNTLFTRYIDEILDYYNIYYEFSKLTAQSVMIGHQEIAPNVYMTIYDNGIRTYVNY